MFPGKLHLDDTVKQKGSPETITKAKRTGSVSFSGIRQEPSVAGGWKAAGNVGLELQRSLSEAWLLGCVKQGGLSG